MEFTGPLNVDATRGKFHEFVLGDRQVLLPESCFQARQYTTQQLYDRNAPPIQVGRELSDEGRKLWNKLRALGGKGVTITGEPYEQYKNFTQDFRIPVACVIATDVVACPSADPPLCPELVELLRAKAEREQAEADRKRAEADQARVDSLRDSTRHAMLTARLQEELKDEVEEQVAEVKRDRQAKKGKNPQSA